MQNMDLIDKIGFSIEIGIEQVHNLQLNSGYNFNIITLIALKFPLNVRNIIPFINP